MEMMRCLQHVMHKRSSASPAAADEASHWEQQWSPTPTPCITHVSPRHHPLHSGSVALDQDVEQNRISGPRNTAKLQMSDFETRLARDGALIKSRGERCKRNVQMGGDCGWSYGTLSGATQTQG
jgi:hypothetical protein